MIQLSSERIQLLPQQEMLPKAVLDFTDETPRESTPGHIRNYAKRALDKRREAGISPTEGDSTLLQEISQWSKNRFDITLDPKTQILAMPSVRDAIFKIGACFLSSANKALTPELSPSMFRLSTVFANGTPMEIPLDSETLLPNLELSNYKGAKLLWLSMPSNPTAKIAPKSYLKQLADFAKDENILLVADESYSEVYYEEKPHSLLEFGEENVLACNGLSLRSLMPGYNIAWIAGDATGIEFLKRFNAETSAALPYFLQDAAVAALQDEMHAKIVRQDCKIKRDHVCSALESIGLAVNRPKATPFIWQEVPKGSNDKEFSLELSKKGIGVIPGSRFGPSDFARRHVRFALGPNLHDCKIASDRIRMMGF